MSQTIPVPVPVADTVLEQIREFHNVVLGGDAMLAQLGNEARAIRVRQLEAALNAGELLIKQKEQMPHGTFGEWAKQLPFTDRTARSYMRIARHREALKTETVSDLTGAYRYVRQIAAGKTEARTLDVSALKRERETLFKAIDKYFSVIPKENRLTALQNLVRGLNELLAKYNLKEVPREINKPEGLLQRCLDIRNQ